MFSNSKKAIEGYIVVLLIVSLVSTVLIFFITEATFTSDPQRCDFVEYEFDVKCQNEAGYKASVTNSVGETVAFEIDGEIDEEKYVFKSKESEDLTVETSKSSTKIVPIIFDENNDAKRCLGKQKNANIEVLPVC